jgi:uncharacterized OB-fold protein
VSSDWLVVEQLAPSADDPLLGPMYAAAAAGDLVLPFCGSCDQALELGQSVCDGCRSEAAQWRVVDNHGTVHSATLVHRREQSLILADAPYPLLDVETSSGHRLIMTTVLPASTLPDIGAPVAIGFRVIGAVHVPAANLVLRDTESSSEGTP